MFIKLSKPFKTRVKASSLPETVMAIAIISVCVLVAFMVYVNVVRSNDSVKYLEAKHKVEELVHQTTSKNDFLDNTYKYGGYSIEKKVTVQENNQLAELNFVINAADKTYVIKKIIPYYNE